MGEQDVLACSMVHLAFSFATGKVECGITSMLVREMNDERSQYKLMRIIPYFNTPCRALQRCIRGRYRGSFRCSSGRPSVGSSLPDEQSCHINPFGRQLINLRVSCEALLMELEAFCFLILPHAGLQGSSYSASSATA